MARRKISETAIVDGKQAKVYRDSEWNEFRVVFYLDGVKVEGSDYHSDDKQDALSTAESWVK